MRVRHPWPPLLLSLVMHAVLLAVPASATTYYIRKSGDDNNSGTSPDQAWKTFAKASDKSRAGDTVYVGAGNYYEKVGLQRDGTAANPIRFIGDTSGAMTGDAGEVAVRKNGDSALRVDADYIEFVGFRLFNSRGVRWGGAGGLLQDCEIDGHSGEGLRIDIAQLTIVDCDVHDNGREGLAVFAASTVDISRSSFRNNGNEGLNLSWDSGTVFTLSACRIHSNNRQGITLGRGTLALTNCLLYDNGRDGLWMGGSISDTSVTIWNCTIASNADAGVYQNDGTLAVTNSIIAHNGGFGMTYAAGAATHTYNQVSSNTVGDYQGLAADPTEISGDPVFENVPLFDYHLTSISPAINAGTDAAGIVDDDLEGAARPYSTGWDLGCYESSFAGASGGWRVLQWVEIDKPGP